MWINDAIVRTLLFRECNTTTYQLFDKYVFRTQCEWRLTAIRKVKAHYVIASRKRDEIVNAIQAKFGRAPNYIESSILMYGEEDSGLEVVKLSLEGEEIKVLVTITNEELLQFFNNLLGNPIKIKR